MTASPVPKSLPASTQAVFALFAELVADPERMAATLDALDQHTAHLAAQTRALLPLIPELNPKRKTKPKPRTKPKHSPRPPSHLARAARQLEERSDEGEGSTSPPAIRLQQPTTPPPKPKPKHTARPPSHLARAAGEVEERSDEGEGSTSPPSTRLQQPTTPPPKPKPKHNARPPSHVARAAGEVEERSDEGEGSNSAPSQRLETPTIAQHHRHRTPPPSRPLSISNSPLPRPPPTHPQLLPSRRDPPHPPPQLKRERAPPPARPPRDPPRRRPNQRPSPLSPASPVDAEETCTSFLHNLHSDLVATPPPRADTGAAPQEELRSTPYGVPILLALADVNADGADVLAISGNLGSTTLDAREPAAPGCAASDISRSAGVPMRQVVTEFRARPGSPIRPRLQVVKRETNVCKCVACSAIWVAAAAACFAPSAA